MRHKAIRAMAAVLLTLPALLAVLPATGGERSVVTWDSDRTVSAMERYADCTIEMEGNLSISGMLALTGVELVIRSPFDLMRNITVEGGGTFCLMDGSVIRSRDPDIHFLFRVRPGGCLQMKDSELHDCGADPFFGIPWDGPDPDFGLYIESGGGSDMVTISNCTLSGNHAAVIVDGGSSPLITDNDICLNEWSGIEVYGTSAPTIARNRISENGFGLFESGCSISRDNQYTGNEYGVALGPGSSARFFNDTVSNSTRAGVAGDTRSEQFSNRMVDCRFLRNAEDVLFDKFMQGGGGGLLVFENTSHDPAAVQATDPVPVLVVEWYLDLSVVYQSTGMPVVMATVNLTDSTGASAAGGITDSGGRIERLCLEEYRFRAGTSTFRSPYTVRVSDGSSTNLTDGISLNRSLELGIVLDDLAPFLEVLSPEDGAPVNAEVVTVTGRTEPDALLTVNGETADVDAGGGWSVEAALECEGPNPISVGATDRAGNRAQVDLTVYRDTIPSLLKLWSPADGLVTNKLAVRVAGSTNDTSATVTVNGQRVGLGEKGDFSLTVDISEGENVISVECLDGAGNRVSINRTVIRDTVPPSLTVEAPRSGTVTGLSSVVAKGSVERDAILTVNGMEHDSPNGRFEVVLPLAEGENYLRFESRDRAGNVNLSIVLVVRDTSSPLLVVLYPLDGARVNRSQLEVRGRSETGATVTVNGIDARVDGANFSAVVPLRDEGKNVIFIETRDALGNRADVTVEVFLDTVPPPVALLDPSNNTLTNRRTVLLRGQTEPGAVVTASGLPLTVDGSGNFSGEIELDREGVNHIRLVARDELHNAAELTLVVCRDTELAYNISLPPEGTSCRASSLLISGNVESGATLVLGDRAVPLGPDGSFSVRVPLSPGTNHIRLSLTDPAGNVAELSVNVTRLGPETGGSVDWTAAALVIAAVAGGAGVAAAVWGLRKRT